MQWYLEDEKRLELETKLMKRNGVNFQLCMDENENLLWRGSLSVLGHYHGDVRLVYPEEFPYRMMDVYVLEPKLPLIVEHVYEDGRICYIKPEEWEPSWTAYAVYLTTIRFLNRFYSGKMDTRLLSSTVHTAYQPKRSFFEKLKEMLFG